MVHRLILFSLLVTLSALASEAQAQRGGPFKQILRFTGHGWSAGYHAGNPGWDSSYYDPWLGHQELDDWDELKNFLGDQAPTQQKQIAQTSYRPASASTAKATPLKSITELATGHPANRPKMPSVTQTLSFDRFLRARNQSSQSMGSLWPKSRK